MAALGGPVSCPPGYYWNPETSQCESILGVGIPPIYSGVGGPPICPPGTYFDPVNNVCIPNPVVVIPPLPLPPSQPIGHPGFGVGPPHVAVPPPGFVQAQPPGQAKPWPPTGPINVWLPPVIPPSGPSTTVTTSGGTTVVPTGPLSGVIVNVDQAVSLTDQSASNAVNSVAEAVYQALQQAASLASGAGDAATTAIESQIGSLTGALEAGIQQAYGSIASVAQGIETSIGQTLGNIGNIIGQDLFGSINPALIALTTIAGTIARQIGGLGGAIASAVAAIIPQIIAAIQNPVGALTGVLQDIEKVLTGQISGITTTVGTIATTLGGLGTTLDTVLLHYEQWNQGFVEAQTGYPQDGTLHHDLSSIAGAIAGIVGSLPSQAAVSLSEYLTYPCDDAIGQSLLHKPFLAPGDPLLTGLWPWEAIIAFVGWLSKTWGAIGKVRQIGEQELNKNCASDLLPIGALVDAVIRGFLPQQQAADEATRANLNNDRFQVLLDLATQQLPQGELTEAKYRGIIQDSDFQKAMAAQGYTAGQINTLAALAINRLPVDLLWRLRHRQLIDDPTLKKALGALQYDSAQQDVLSTLTFRPPNTNEAIDGAASQVALQQLGLGGLASDTAIPEYVSVAGMNEGLDAQATAARWFAHWNTGSIGSYLTLYFRGQISLEALQAVMGKNFIPAELVTTLVEASRPIVQYRTISNMLRIGQINQQQAAELLSQHGYSPQNVDLLIAYAQRPTPSPRPKQLHAISLAISKREWIDGSISDDEYFQILIQHGYTVTGANAELAVERAQQATLVRKQNAQLVVDEYGAGLINEQTALAQLAALGLTVFELAKYAHKIRVFRVKAAKHPTEAELNDFRKNAIIDAKTYTAQLALLGYSEQVAGWFTQWRTASPVTPSATPAGPATSAGG